MAKAYDYLIVGAGLFGAVFAHEAAKAGRKCLVIDKRDHIAGNAYEERLIDEIASREKESQRIEVRIMIA